MKIDKFYIERISNLKYPDVVTNYLMTNNAAYKILKINRRNLTMDDIIDILEHKSDNFYSSHIRDILSYVFDDLGAKITKEVAIRLAKRFDDVEEFANFIHKVSNSSEVFSHQDIKKISKGSRRILDLINTRSFKIYQIENGE